MRKTLVGILAIASSMGAAAFAADREIKVGDRLDASAETLIDVMKAPDKGIPQDLLDKAHCLSRWHKEASQQTPLSAAYYCSIRLG